MPTSNRIRQLSLRLLLAADRGHLRPRDRVVESTRLSVGDEAVGDQRASVGKCRDGARGTEVDIVGVSGDDERSLDLVHWEHTASVRRVDVSEPRTRRLLAYHPPHE